MKTENRLIYSAVLNNNCPECYSNNGLKLDFFQEYKENRWYKKYTNQVSSSMQCTNCNQAIYPVSWTEDIERVFEYHQKNAGIKAAKTQWKLATLVVLLLGVVLVAAAIVLSITYL